MVIKFYDVGPGKLILGGPGPLAIEQQCRSCRVVASESVTTTDKKPVLGGGALPGSSRSDVTFTLVVTVIQDISAGGLVDWSYDHYDPTETEPFIYVPNNDEARARWGDVHVFPIDFGGDAEEHAPEASFTWRIEGWPSKGTYDPIEGDLTEDI